MPPRAGSPPPPPRSSARCASSRAIRASGRSSRELPDPDCPPIRVQMLGEDLLAFRDTQGRVGLIEPTCAHRGANLFFGRNEEGGIRCIYHGWKYDVDGKCLEMPNVPAGAAY